MKKIVGSHELGMMMEMYEDGTARLVFWVDGNSKTVEDLEVKGAFANAASLLEKWGVMFKECSEC